MQKDLCSVLADDCINFIDEKLEEDEEAEDIIQGFQVYVDEELLNY